jgi:hypothetical protein
MTPRSESRAMGPLCMTVETISGFALCDVSACAVCPRNGSVLHAPACTLTSQRLVLEHKEGYVQPLPDDVG